MANGGNPKLAKLLTKTLTNYMFPCSTGTIFSTRRALPTEEIGWPQFWCTWQMSRKGEKRCSQKSRHPVASTQDSRTAHDIALARSLRREMVRIESSQTNSIHLKRSANLRRCWNLEDNFCKRISVVSDCGLCSHQCACLRVDKDL